MLFENDIAYKYKRDFRRNGTNYRPDFTIDTPLSSVVIECFGIHGEDDYDERAQEKRRHWQSLKNPAWTFLEFSLADLRNGEEAFTSELLQKLQRAGINHRRLSEEEIWERIRGQAVDQFTEVMTSFVGHSRRRNLSLDALGSMVKAHNTISKSERMFLEVGKSVYSAYIERLMAQQTEDFNGLMWRAVSKVREGKSDFIRDGRREQGDLTRLNFVMIDEFQDFSQTFYELVDAIRSINSEVKFFCVGDDWQAINAFAGSELRFFESCEDYFVNVARREIPTNYRSVASVVEVGNALMYGKGTPARPSRCESETIWLGDLNEFHPSAFESERFRDRDIPAVLRVIWHFLNQSQNVAVLSRINTAQDFLRGIQSGLPSAYRSRVSASTAHKYKGREKEAVIVLDAVQGRYPLIHPSWVFLRIFGDNLNKIEEEERRLFYVALTRAQDSLAILTDSLRKSPYLDDIARQFRVTTLAWNSLEQAPPLTSPKGEKLEVRVYDAYEVREQLKENGYRWNPNNRYWYKVIPANGFYFDNLCIQPWASKRKIEVYSETGELRYCWPSR